MNKTVQDFVERGEKTIYMVVRLSELRLLKRTTREYSVGH